MRQAVRTVELIPKSVPSVAQSSRSASSGLPRTRSWIPAMSRPNSAPRRCPASMKLCSAALAHRSAADGGASPPAFKFTWASARHPRDAGSVAAMGSTRASSRASARSEVS